MSATRPRPPHAPADLRVRALTATALATIALGAAIAWWPEGDWLPRLPEARYVPRATSPAARDAREVETRSRFEQGVVMLHMRQYDHAAKAFARVIELAPRLPEAHANMGFALLGLERWHAARDAFTRATDLRPEQFNAYYGLAIAYDALGDKGGAIGAMRTYLHRAPAADSFRRKAEAALWEWTGTPPDDVETSGGHPPVGSPPPESEGASQSSQGG